MGVETLVSISNALEVSPITVLRKAGLLPPGPDEDISFDDWKYLLEQLTPDEREEMRQIFVMKIERRQKAEQTERARNFKPKKSVK